MKHYLKNRLSLRSLRLSLRFVLPLVAALALLAFAIVPIVDNLTLRWFVRDMDIRSQLIASAIQEPLTELLPQGDRARINKLFRRAIQDERLFAIGYCDGTGKMTYRTPNFPGEISCSLPVTAPYKPRSLLQLPRGPVHVAINPINYDGVGGSLVLVHDMSFVERRSADTKKYVIILFVALGVVISIITVFIAHLSWQG